MKIRLLFHLSLLVGLSGCTTEPLFNFAVRGSLSPSGGGARGTGGADRLDVPIFSFYVAATPECTSPQVVIDYGGEPLVKDFGTGPVLFSGKLENGTYPCAVLQISDLFHFRPDATARGAFTECTDALHRTDTYTSGALEDWRDLSGETISGAGTQSAPSGQIVTLFFSTDPEAVKQARNLADSQIVELSEAFEVPGEVILYFDLTDRAEGGSGLCYLEQPLAGLGLR